jgi:hypothetical protein
MFSCSVTRGCDTVLASYQNASVSASSSTCTNSHSNGAVIYDVTYVNVFTNSHGCALVYIHERERERERERECVCVCVYIEQRLERPRGYVTYATVPYVTYVQK